MVHIPVENGKILLLAGPTASGKSALALKIAQQTDAVIINADSMQVYRELPILTAQPTAEEQEKAPHRLYGCIPASEHFSVGAWLPLAKREIDAALAAGKTPVLVGGTGLYFKCLMEGIAEIPNVSRETREETDSLFKAIGNEALHRMLAGKDPETAARLSPGNTQRLLRAWEVWAETGVPLSEWQRQKHQRYYGLEHFACYFLSPERQALYNRINQRFLDMLEKGALEEARQLMEIGISTSPSRREVGANGLSSSLPAMKAHGVPELITYLKGKMTLEAATTKAQQNTRNYAKRQYTWFRHQLPEFQKVY